MLWHVMKAAAGEIVEVVVTEFGVVDGDASIKVEKELHIKGVATAQFKQIDGELHRLLSRCTPPIGTHTSIWLNLENDVPEPPAIDRREIVG